MRGQESLFSARTLTALIAIASIGLFGMVIMRMFGDDLVPQQSAGANAYSYSAIGHRAAVEVLRRSGHNVIVSRHDSGGKAGFGGILILAEPHPSALTADFHQSFASARNVLLVLPKWHGRTDPTRRNWLKSVAPRPEGYVDIVITEITRQPKTSLVRRQSAGTFNVNPTAIAPDLGNRQLIQGDRLVPVIAGPDGALLARIRVGRQNVWVLSDPDIMNNHGLGRGNNATLLAEILRQINPAASALVFDETIHGFGRQPSLWYAVLEFPFIVVTFSGIVATAFFLWAAIGRFGAPLPQPPVALGKAGLIANTANLLRAGGHAAHVLDRYAEATIRDVAERLHCPHGPGSAARLQWLDQVGDARGVSRGIASINSRVAAASRDNRGMAAIAATARQLYRWKQEILHGS